MKFGLILPNGRNSYEMSQDDLYFAKFGKHRKGIERQIAFSKQNADQLKKTLDKWKQSAQTHKSGTALTIKLTKE